MNLGWAAASRFFVLLPQNHQYVQLQGRPEDLQLWLSIEGVLLVSLRMRSALGLPLDQTGFATPALLTFEAR